MGKFFLLMRLTDLEGSDGHVEEQLTELIERWVVMVVRTGLVHS